VGVSLATGCDAAAPEVTAPPGPFQIVIEGAREGGADAAQLEILLAADAAGEVTFDQLRQAVDATFACMDDAGIEYAETVTEGPLPQLTYSFASADGSSTIADDCINTHSMYVEWAYQTQPAAQELVDAAFEARRGEIVPCLQRLGLALADDASVDEIKSAASFTIEEWESTWKDAPVTPHDCVINAGILNW
jgi:hypothetical protein